MVDPLSLAKVVKDILDLVAWIIDKMKQAKLNRKECCSISELVKDVESIVKLWQKLPQEMKDEPAMSRPMEKLMKSLTGARDVIKDCMKQRSADPDKMAKRLRMVRDEISEKLKLMIFANSTFTILLTDSNKSTLEEIVALLENSQSEVKSQLAEMKDSFNKKFDSMNQKVDSVAFLVQLSQEREALDARTSKSTKDASCSRNETKGKTKETDGASTARSEVMGDNKNVPAGTKASSPLDPCGFKEYSSSELEEIKKLRTYTYRHELPSNSFNVYKGNLSDGKKVIISQIAVYNYAHNDGVLLGPKKAMPPRPKTFPSKKRLHEAVLLASTLHHKNIGKPLGYCDKAIPQDSHGMGTFSVVEEDMRSLFTTFKGGASIDWSSCSEMIRGIAEGVYYLHNQDVVHFNLSWFNIFLDSENNPVIRNFLAARKITGEIGIGRNSEIGLLSPSDHSEFVAPEYFRDRKKLSKAFDIYGFGVAILKIIRGTCEKDTTAWAWKVMYEDRSLDNLLARRSLKPDQKTEVKNCMKLGLLCCQTESSDRPSMEDVLRVLRTKEYDLEPPKKPHITPSSSVCWLYVIIIGLLLLWFKG